ncbi:MlaA family lipoprotein [Shumkonia mesophila]|uniref:MlaA family lipoprotein n=1 Tax=Shumkonia mesophila TaxID=2838854 RepID=UPI002934CE95|nr:VacJ family lipoprotein [Shumkonia mesophila]
MKVLYADDRGRAGWPVLGALVLVLGLVAGCATAPDPTDREAVVEFQQINDPGEPTNRAVFAVNQVLDKGVLKPAAGMYRHLVPPAVRTGVGNALNNLRSPVIFFNDVLQGEMRRAGVTFMRFVINTTIGIGGLGDPASDMGFPYHSEDFGQTLAAWGVGEGPFVMLPVFGPSNPRDAVGLVVDFLVDPINMWANNTDREYITYARGATRAVDERARNYDLLEDIERSSLDFYATIRSLYRQRRVDEIGNGETRGNVPGPGVTETPRLNSEEVSQWK